MWKWSHRAALVIIVLLGLIEYRYSPFREGIPVAIKNRGPSTLKQVTVVLDGGVTYRIGDILPGYSRQVRVYPIQETDVALEFCNGNGEITTLRADCYFEPRYFGRIWITVASDRITKLRTTGMVSGGGDCPLP